jgi:hypothetical protein
VIAFELARVEGLITKRKPVENLMAELLDFHPDRRSAHVCLREGGLETATAGTARGEQIIWPKADSGKNSDLTQAAVRKAGLSAGSSPCGAPRIAGIM